MEKLLNHSSWMNSYENPTVFEQLDGYGLIAKFREALKNSTNLSDLTQQVSEALRSGNKAEFALDLLYSEEVKNLKVPTYIHEGLVWLSELLKRKEKDIVGNPKGDEA